MKFLNFLGVFVFSIGLHSQPASLTDTYDQNGEKVIRWLVCKDDNCLKLTPWEAKDPSKCYTWEPQNAIEGDFHNYEITGCPEVTTLFICKKIDCTTGQIIKTYKIKVYVIEDIQLNEINGLPGGEYMDEYTVLYFKGTLIGADLADVSTAKSVIRLEFQTSQNHGIPSSDLTIKNGIFYSSALKVQYVKPPEKEYVLQAKAYWNNNNIQCESNVIQIKIIRLWIDYFSDDATSDQNRVYWQVVVQRPIQYKAIATNYCKNFKWKLMSKWELLNTNKKEGHDMIIDSTKVGTNTINNDYGITHGNVYLSCKDHKNRSIEVTSSMAVRQSSPGSLPIYYRYMSTKRCSVFFHKDSRYPSTNPFSITPNWYIYWIYGGCANFKDYFLPKKYYKGNGRIGNEIKYGETYIDYHKFPIYGQLFLYDDASKFDQIAMTHGLHCFNSVIFHESYHVEIKRVFWANDGWRSWADTDDDGYPDWWEKLNPNLGFEVRPPFDNFDSNFSNSNSPGSLYEEPICRQYQIEKCEIDHSCIDFDWYDWSYDRNYIFQGKQWLR